MKTKLIAYALLAVVLASCSDNGMPNVKTTFTVRKIELNKKNMAIYLLTTNEHGDLSTGSVWIFDSIDSFKVGDTLSFCYNR